MSTKRIVFVALPLLLAPIIHGIHSLSSGFEVYALAPDPKLSGAASPQATFPGRGMGGPPAGGGVADPGENPLTLPGRGMGGPPAGGGVADPEVQIEQNEICSNGVDDDSDGTVDEQECIIIPETDQPSSDQAANQILTEPCLPEQECAEPEPPSSTPHPTLPNATGIQTEIPTTAGAEIIQNEICSNGVDDDSDGTVDEQECIIIPEDVEEPPPPVEPQ